MTIKPTYLYIKQHAVTKMLYLGKTIKNPERYLGSGIKWRAHIKKHGKEHVVNLWYCLFLDETTLCECADALSVLYQVDEASQWANIIPENGINGGPANLGITRSVEARRKQSASSKGHKKTFVVPRAPLTETHKQHILDSNKARRKTWICTNHQTNETHTLQCMEFVRQFGGDFSTIHIAMNKGKRYKHWTFIPLSE